MSVGKAGLLITILFLAACTSPAQREQEYQELINTHYIGQNIEKIVQKFGHADSLSAAPNGNRVFVYSSFQIDSTPVSCSKDKNGNQSCSGGSSTERWCKTYFEVDSENIVVDFSNKGDSYNCRSCAYGGGFLCLEPPTGVQQRNPRI